MRFSLFAVLSGLAALAVVGALPTENAPSEDVSHPKMDCVVNLPILGCIV
ncbi:hypothetical protein EV363DRAFT_1446248 [Boletus edulis]|nr:hypothetical protein EV363DRAFT_1446248 [Boletus edulis]